MRNLKRALSLALAAAMLIGMMVISASAVSYNSFTDRDEIVNKDAVSMLTTLGIIEGKPDGSYAPSENVDRAQMAKMISVMLSNNEDCDDLYMSVNSGLTDVAGNWAQGYINYCYTLDIIAGREPALGAAEAQRLVQTFLAEQEARQQAAMAEPLTISLHGIHRGGLQAGEYCAIIGAGPIGLVAGILPAARATKISALEAIRHE